MLQIAFFVGDCSFKFNITMMEIVPAPFDSRLRGSHFPRFTGEELSEAFYPHAAI
jgi:hypothetical protein